MKRISKASGVLAIVVGAAAPAFGQSWEAIRFTPVQAGGSGTVVATDASIAVSTDRIVLATNEFLQLRYKNGNNIVTVGEGLTSDLPFTPVETSYRFFDPRVEYDPNSGRIWIFYCESTWTHSNDQALLHVAVSKDSSPDSFTSADWHFFTGTNAFDFKDSTFVTQGVAYDGMIDHPTFSFDDDWVYMQGRDYRFTLSSPPVDDRTAIAAIPINHGASLSMLNGDRPSESLIKLIQLELLSPDPDDSEYALRRSRAPGRYRGGRAVLPRHDRTPVRARWRPADSP